MRAVKEKSQAVRVVAKSVLLPGIFERRLGVSLYTQPAGPVLGAPAVVQRLCNKRRGQCSKPAGIAHHRALTF